MRYGLNKQLNKAHKLVTQVVHIAFATIRTILSWPQRLVATISFSLAEFRSSTLANLSPIHAPTEAIMAPKAVAATKKLSKSKLSC